MFKLSSLRALNLGAACLLAAGVSAHANYASIHNQTVVPGSGNHFEWYVDFASTTSAAHQPFSYLTGTFGGTAGLKYHVVGLGTYGNAASACYEVRTIRVTTPDTDTRIWFAPQSGNPAQVSLNDDANGSVYSVVRVWLQGQDAYVALNVAAYSTNHNAGHFRISADRLPLTETACTNGQTTIAWVKHKWATGGVVTQTWQSR